MIKKSMDESNQGFMKHLGGLELKKISDTQYEFIVERNPPCAILPVFKCISLTSTVNSY